MNNILKGLLLIPGLLFFCEKTFAAETPVDKSTTKTSNQGTQSISPSLDDFSFLNGNWVNKEKSGAFAEEYWSQPNGDSIIGHFKTVKDGRTSLYELLSLVNSPSGIVLHVRHCNGDFVPWQESEEPGDFAITSFDSGKQVTFENKKERHVKLTYKRPGAKQFSVLVEITQKDGKVSNYSYDFEHAD